MLLYIFYKLKFKIVCYICVNWIFFKFKTPGNTWYYSCIVVNQ